MSIADDIYRLECDGKIHRIEVRTRHVLKRRLYLTKKTKKDHDNNHSPVNMLTGRGFVEAAFSRWVTGGLIYAAEDGRKAKFLKELDPPPPDIWEIRLTEPLVQARLLGAFPEPNTLILTGLHTRPFLGKRGSANWIAAIQECEDTWSDLGLPRFRANTIHEYVTENCDDFPLKR